MKNIRGISTKLVAVILVLIAGGAAAAYILSTDFPVRVMEPLNITAHPETLSIYPNTTTFFNITVDNAASVNYLATLTFSLNDTAYQQTYVTFSNTTYNIIPGTNNLTASATIAADAPPTLLQLTVGLSRINEAQPTFDYTFTWSNMTQSLVNGTLVLKMSFIHTQDRLLITAQINDTYPGNYSDLGLAFDNDFNGLFDNNGYMLFGDNTSLSDWGVVVDPFGDMHYALQDAHGIPVPSPYHNATFNKDTGWTYYVALPKARLPQKQHYWDGLKIHVCFHTYAWRPLSTSYSFVFTEFLYEIWGTGEREW